jgi:glycosyltransferase involved in cell wall biosynthesis
MRRASTFPLSEDDETLRVHLVAHHHLDRAAGVSGATLALGAALQERGCEVSYYSFDDAYGAVAGSEIPRMLRFPWRVAHHLAHAATFDVVDATTGDAWVWASRRRRGNERAALVTRAHGLEHVMSADMRQRTRTGQMRLSRKYPLYHGGYRLWEVRRSLLASDAQIFLNETDRSFAAERLGVDPSTSVVLPNGVADRLLDLPPVEIVSAEEPIALAFVGSWIARKGIDAVVEMANLLRSRDVPFTLRLLGTGADAGTVLGAFAPEIRDRVRVTPRFEPRELPELLAGAEVLLHPSWTEGFSLGLVEGMACGLTPVATRSGGSTTVVRDTETGLLLPDESGSALANAVVRLASDRALLARLRTAAQRSVQMLRWDSIAARTMDVYRAAILRRRTVMGLTT